MSNVQTLRKIVAKKWDAISITELPAGFRVYVVDHRYAGVETCAKHLQPFTLVAMGWNNYEGYYFDVRL